MQSLFAGAVAESKDLERNLKEMEKVASVTLEGHQYALGGADTTNRSLALKLAQALTRSSEIERQRRLADITLMNEIEKRLVLEGELETVKKLAIKTEHEMLHYRAANKRLEEESSHMKAQLVEARREAELAEEATRSVERELRERMQGRAEDEVALVKVWLILPGSLYYIHTIYLLPGLMDSAPFLLTPHDPSWQARRDLETDEILEASLKQQVKELEAQVVLLRNLIRDQALMLSDATGRKDDVQVKLEEMEKASEEERRRRVASERRHLDASEALEQTASLLEGTQKDLAHTIAKSNHELKKERDRVADLELGEKQLESRLEDMTRRFEGKEGEWLVLKNEMEAAREMVAMIAQVGIKL